VLIRNAVTLSLMLVVGAGAGLFIVYRREKGETLNLRDPEQRRWAAEKIREAVSSASAKALRSKDEIEKWLKVRGENLPDTQELLQRAIEYLEAPEHPADGREKVAAAGHVPAARPVEAATEPVRTVEPEQTAVKPPTEASAPENAPAAAPETPPTPETASPDAKPPEAAKLRPAAEHQTAASAKLPDTPAIWSGGAASDAAVPLQACRWDDPTCSAETVENPKDTAVPAEAPRPAAPHVQPAAAGTVKAPPGTPAAVSRREASPDYRTARDCFRKGLEHYKLSTPGTPAEQEKIALAETEFRSAQEAIGRYLDANPDDAEAEDFFVEINRFLYDCLKRKTVDAR